MATIPSPRTWAAGEEVTASLVNLHLRDALNFLLNPPMVEAFNAGTGNNGLASGAWTRLTFDSESWDTDTMHDLITNPWKLTFVTGGVYEIETHVEWAANATGVRAIELEINNATGTQNGTLAIDDDRRPATSAAVATTTQIVKRYKAVAGDFASVFGFQNSGAGLNVNTGITGCRISAVRIGAG